MAILSQNKTLKRKKLVPPTPVRIEGEYSATLKSWFVGSYRGNPKLYLHWQLVGACDDDGKPIVLCEYYNINVLKNGQLEAGYSSKYMRHYATIFDVYPKSTKGITPDVYMNCVVKLKTRLVTKDREGKALIGGATYSVIDTMLGLEAGGRE